MNLLGVLGFSLEPAREEASRVLQDAEDKAKHIVEQALEQAKGLLEQARAQAKQEEEVFQGNLKQAAKQGMEALRQSIEKELFHKELHGEVQKAMADEKMLGKLIESLVAAIQKEGLQTSLEVQVPKSCDAKALAGQVSGTLLKELKDKELKLGAFGGGIKVRLEGQNLTLDFSDEALIEVLVAYVRKDFRELFFN